MGANKPVTDAERTRIRELHAQGKARNEIARELGRSGATITKIAGRMGLNFDVAQTGKATAGKVATARAMRAELAIEALQKAKQFLRQIDEPHTAFSFGGRDNTYNEKQLDRPPTGDIRHLMQSFGIAVEKALRLTDYDGGDSASEARSLLGRLFGDLQAQHGTGDAD